MEGSEEAMLRKGVKNIVGKASQYPGEQDILRAGEEPVPTSGLGVMAIWKPHTKKVTKNTP